MFHFQESALQDKVGFESHCHILPLDRGVTTSFEVEEGGRRQRPPSVLWFDGSCSSIVV